MLESNEVHLLKLVRFWGPELFYTGTAWQIFDYLLLCIDVMTSYFSDLKSTNTLGSII